MALRISTGDERVDTLLRGLVALFETSFPRRIRCYYLGGSYSDGTAAGDDASPNSSDLDLFVIVRHAFDAHESARFQQLVAACRMISPIQIDAHAYAEDDLIGKPRPGATQTAFLTALIRDAGAPIYGDDLRPDLPAVPFSRYILDVIESGVFHLGIPRQPVSLSYPLAAPLVPPLDYPDAASTFYGYDAVPARSGAPGGTRVLAAIAGWIATLLLALETGHYATRKSQSIQFCNEYLPDDPRVRLASTVVDLCKGTWHYALPSSTQDRARLRSLCRDMPGLENAYLDLCRDYILDRLRHGEDEEKRQALRILRSVAYRDAEIAAARQAAETTCSAS